MATQLDYPLIIKNIIQQYAKYKPAHGDIETTVSFDDKHANYTMLQSISLYTTPIS
jgi:hypothetical protein